MKKLYPFVITTVVCSCGGNNAKTASDATSVDEGSNTEVVENAVAEGWDDDDESYEEDESFPPTISYSEDGKVKVISARYQTM